MDTSAGSMEKEEKKYKYYAFISYCTENEKWARWIHRSLEHYRIPTRLCTEYPSLPKRIQPVFWYKVDLSGTKLLESLLKELEKSRYLIVICSPHSAQSSWVNREIESFIKMNGSRYIIPLIVDGEPKSGNPETECFPPALRELSQEEEIRGIDLRASGKKRALVDVVATMFGVSFDTLWQRQKRREFRNNLIIGALSILLAFCSILAFNFFKTSKEYYLNYEICNGMPEGIDPKKQSELKSQMNYYVFESSQGKLRRVVYRSRYGAIVNPTSTASQFRSAIMELGYEGSKLRSITHCNAIGHALYRVIYSDDYKSGDIKDAESGDASSLFSSSSSAVENLGISNEINLNSILGKTKSQIARYVYEYDDEGFIKRLHFKRHNGSNETGFDDNGICGIEYERDSRHRVIKKRYLGEDGEYVEDKFGCSGCEYRFDDSGFMIFERFFDKDNNNEICDLGYSYCKSSYDPEKGQYVEYLFDKEDKPTTNFSGYHKVIVDFFDKLYTQSYFSVDGKPVAFFDNIRNTGLYHKTYIEMDDNGNGVDLKFFGIDGKPCYDINGVHRIICEFDDRNRVVKSVCYNKENRKCVNGGGVCEIRYGYQDNNINSLEFFDTEGRKINSNAGFSTLKINFKGNKPVLYTSFDCNNMPVGTQATFGAPVVELGYDDFGNISDVRLKDGSFSTQFIPDDVLCRIKLKYKNGRCVSQEFMNKSDMPVEGLNGYSKAVSEYDNKGRLKKTEFFDAEGNYATNYVTAASIEEYEYDNFGRITEQRCYNNKKQLMLCNDGWAIKRNEYDGINIKRLKSFGTKGEPILCTTLGAHCKEYDSNSKGQVIAERSYGINNEPLINSGGFFECRYKYNLNGIKIEECYYGKDGKPVNTVYGPHKIKYFPNERNSMVYEKYFDVNDELVINTNTGYAARVIDYNEIGLPTDIYYYDGNMQLANNRITGNAREIRRYTYSYKPLLQAFLDKDGVPVIVYGDNGTFYAVSYSYYDDKENIIGNVLLDSFGNEVRSGVSQFEGKEFKGYLIRENAWEANIRYADGTVKELEHPLFSGDPLSTQSHHLLDSIVTDARHRISGLIDLKFKK